MAGGTSDRSAALSQAKGAPEQSLPVRGVRSGAEMAQLQHRHCARSLAGAAQGQCGLSTAVKWILPQQSAHYTLHSFQSSLLKEDLSGAFPLATRAGQGKLSVNNKRESIEQSMDLGPRNSRRSKNDSDNRV